MQEDQLLQQIYQGANTGSYSIQTVLPKVTDGSISTQLLAYQHKLEAIALAARRMLAKRGVECKEQGIAQKMSIWSGVQWNSAMDHSPSHIAEMIIQGDTMGITDLTGALNHTPMADSSIRALGTELVDIQRQNIEIMKNYL